MTPDKLTYEVEKGLLYGRPGPNKSYWHLDVFKDFGIHVILSLVANPTRKEVERHGLIHEQLLFEDHIYKPYKSANQHALDILVRFDALLDRYLPRHLPILVHCNSGKDRTGLLMGYYMVTRWELSAKRALKALKKLKPNALSAGDYTPFFFAMETWMIERRNDTSC